MSASDFIKYILSAIVVRIKSGPLRGKKWIAASGVKFVRGDYEVEETGVITAMLRSGDVFYDIGAHHGYYSVIASDIVGEGGQVVSFEPRHINLAYLQKHIKINGCTNVRTINACVSDTPGTVCFDANHGTGTGRISPDGNMVAQSVSLDVLVSSGELPPPNFMKIDVECAESLVLKGAKNVMTEHRPTIMLSIHGKEQHDQCGEILRTLGYEWQVMSGDYESCDFLASHAGAC